jgi:hypothetical protein
MKTLKVSLIATVIGTGAWLSGLARMIWPSHPMWAVLFLTIATTVGLWFAWSEPHK